MYLGPPPRRRKPSLTPMIDVVFLLLVFFMLAARFGHDVEINLPLGAGSDTPYQGPPRLVDVFPDTLRLNGVTRAPDTLPREVGSLMQAPDDAILLRARDGADLQRLIAVMEDLSEAGFTALILVEASE